MAIKIRCRRCHKRISIDEAFAGGNCRCPYCKATTTVPARKTPAPPGWARPARPDSPVAPGLRPVRPAFPGAPAPAVTAAAEAEGAESVPLASPVVVQGVVALILSALLVLMVAGAAVVYFTWGRSGEEAPAAGPPPVDTAEEGPPAPPATQPADSGPPPPSRKSIFAPAGTRVAGMEFNPPVIYVIDGSWSMADFFDPAAAVVRHSIRSLDPAHRFNLIVVTEKKLLSLSEEWVGGGAGGDAEAKRFLRGYQPAWKTELAGGLRRAMDASPKTVVLLAAKSAANPPALIEKAQDAGVAIFTVCLGGDAPAARGLAELAKLTGGRYRQFELNEMMELFEDAPPLP